MSTSNDNNRRDNDRRDDRYNDYDKRDDRNSRDYRREDEYRSSNTRDRDSRRDDRYDSRDRRDDYRRDDRGRDDRRYDDRDRRGDRFDYRSRDQGWRDRGYMRLDDQPRSPPPPRRDILSTPYRGGYGGYDSYGPGYSSRDGSYALRRSHSVFHSSAPYTTTGNGVRRVDSRVVGSGAVFEPNNQPVVGSIAPPPVSRRLSLGAQVGNTTTASRSRPLFRSGSTPYGGAFGSPGVVRAAVPMRFDDRPTHLLVEEYVQETLRGNHTKVFEMFYDEYVTMSDNGISERVGKRECREFKQRFLESIVTWHDIRVRSVICDGNTAVLEFLFDVTFRSGRRMIQKQALVQRWRHGRIEHEVSYHTV